MIIGHQKIIQFLSRSINKGKIVQAYLFSGPENVGKFTIAKLFAESIIKGSNLINTDVNGNNNNLDLIIVEPEKEKKKGVIKERDIKIEQVREARKNLLLFPYQGKYKVLIINNAHKMNDTAQNSLLKILEEPNSTSVIVLVTHNHLMILPTLRSRCQRINFSLVSEDKIKEVLKEKKVRNIDELSSLSMGRPGMSVILSEDEEEFSMRRRTLADLRKLPSLNINQRLNMAEELSKNIVQAVKKLELWIWIMRLEELEKAESQSFSKGGNFNRIEMIEKSLAVLQQTNANSRLVLENLLINF